MALARRHAAARPAALGFLYADGHARAYCGTRNVQKTHIARLEFPAPATGETWVTDQDGDPVFMVAAEPSESLATVTSAVDRGREHDYDLADTTATLDINDGPRKGETLSLRQVSRRVPARGGATRGTTWQIHALTTRKDLAAGRCAGG